MFIPGSDFICSPVLVIKSATWILNSLLVSINPPIYDSWTKTPLGSYRYIFPVKSLATIVKFVAKTLSKFKEPNQKRFPPLVIFFKGT